MREGRRTEASWLTHRQRELPQVTYPHHFESVVNVAATPEALFAEIDDPSRLAGHMTRSSIMMAGSRMEFSYDEAGGKAAGSKITMAGSILGLRIALQEIVTDRVRPFHKVWETVGEPRLLVIGGYRMGFNITPDAEGSILKVFIDWREPPAPWRWLGRLFGRTYARWCTESMARGAASSFENPPTLQRNVAT